MSDFEQNYWIYCLYSIYEKYDYDIYYWFQIIMKNQLASSSEEENMQSEENNPEYVRFIKTNKIFLLLFRYEMIQMFFDEYEITSFNANEVKLF